MSMNTEAIPAGDLPERLPQRFRFRKPGCNYRNGWDYGLCAPCGNQWEASTTAFGYGCFEDDPWEVLGHLIGDVEAFEWIDNDYGWEGMKQNDLIPWEVKVPIRDGYDAYVIFACSRNHAIESIIEHACRIDSITRREFERNYKPEVRRLPMSELNGRCFKWKID